MEQRLQDIANLFNPLPGMGVGMGVGDLPTYPHYPTSHYPYQSNSAQNGQFAHPHPHSAVLHHNASLADLGAQQPHYGGNLGNAVSSSMHLTNASHESDSASAGGYKMDHDNMMYYSNTSSELNHTQDSFMNSLYEDDLQYDMNANEGYYSMRMLDTNTTSQNSSVLGASIASGPIGLPGIGLAAGGATGGGGGGHHLNANNGLLGASMQTNQLCASLGGAAIGSTGGGDRLDASSDSAVSSMGSERVPSLSDSEWGDGAGSDSAQEYHQRNSSKFGRAPYDYSYSRGAVGNDASRHPVAQKKHQMFGKRYFQEQSTVPSLPQSAAGGAPPPGNSIKYEFEPYGMHSAMPHNTLELGVCGQQPAIAPGGGANKMHSAGPHLSADSSELKYSCSLDFARQTRIGGPAGQAPSVQELINHNHTYALPHGSGASPRPQTRDKKQRRAEDEHLSRDEKRARSLHIPMPVHEIINLPMDEFNERLSKYDLTESQLSLIRDIRRRGKNKVAAQNCRKRKLDQIICLADEVKDVRERKERIYRDREIGISSNEHIKRKFSMLHKHIFLHLRDADGNLYSSSEFSLQQSHDGSVHILRKDKDGGRNGAANGGAAGGSASNGSGSGPHHHNHHHPGNGQGPSSQHQQQQHHHTHHPHNPHHPHHPKD